MTEKDRLGEIDNKTLHILKYALESVIPAEINGENISQLRTKLKRLYYKDPLQWLKALDHAVSLAYMMANDESQFGPDNTQDERVRRIAQSLMGVFRQRPHRRI